MKTDPIGPHLPICHRQSATALPRSGNRRTVHRQAWRPPLPARSLRHRFPGWILLACCGVFFGQDRSEAAPRSGYASSGVVRRDAKPRPYLGHVYARPDRVPRPNLQRPPVVTHYQRMDGGPRASRPAFEGYTGRRRTPVLRPAGEFYTFRPEPPPRLRPVQGIKPSPKLADAGAKKGSGTKSSGNEGKSRAAEPKKRPAADDTQPPEVPFAAADEGAVGVPRKSPPVVAPTPKPEESQRSGDYDHLPIATPVPGKAGFVTLPGKHSSLPEIDVRGIDSGTAAEIPDPNIPGSTIQFRVP